MSGEDALDTKAPEPAAVGKPLQMNVIGDVLTKQVRVEFNQSIAWIGMEPAEALKLAKLIKQAARQLV